MEDPRECIGVEQLNKAKISKEPDVEGKTPDRNDREKT